ncbi:MAG: hypothetical protein JXB35_14230 [Anaerolineae bacterium]|nr:hypothetical protein [Anaerolineae bacterium]
MTTAPVTPSDEDRALLQRFEPVVHFTGGERFFPMDVERYVQEASLWVQRPGEPPLCLVEEDVLTLECLAEPHPNEPETVVFLKFIEPLNIAELAAYEVKRVRQGLAEHKSKEVFRAGLGRLARVGYLSRFVDALFSLSLLARGRVPGDTAAAAALAYERMQHADERYQYYGRVVRQAGWIVLQYWFFYAFNNWRSGFFGVNDHEADWELISIYCYEPDVGDVRPRWVAYASHDFSGDDLRRRWDDPELEKVGEHPVVYAAAGSHASYFHPGEYMTELELPFLRPLARATAWFRERLRQVRREVISEDVRRDSDGLNVFRVPFIDYARGDGRAIGPGQTKTWSLPELLTPASAWVWGYRGLWGLFARDPIAGENAPAGPRYNRDGTVRRSWYDPLGWAGLDKVAPPHLVLSRVAAQCREIAEQRGVQEQRIAACLPALVQLGAEAEALQCAPHLEAEYRAHQERIAALSEELRALREMLETGAARLEALKLQAGRLASGDFGPPRAHITRAHRPASAAERRMHRVAELWAAISIGAMLVATVLLALFSREHLVGGLAALFAVFVFIEAGFRKRLDRLISSVTLALALVASLILVYEFFWQLVVLGAFLIGAYLIWENLRELLG